MENTNNNVPFYDPGIFKKKTDALGILSQKL